MKSKPETSLKATFGQDSGPCTCCRGCPTFLGTGICLNEVNACQLMLTFRDTLGI